MSTIHGVADAEPEARASGRAFSAAFGSDEGAASGTFTESVLDADLRVSAVRADDALEAAVRTPAAVAGELDEDGAAADAPEASVGAGTCAVAAGAASMGALCAVRVIAKLVVLGGSSTRAAAGFEGAEGGR